MKRLYIFVSAAVLGSAVPAAAQQSVGGFTISGRVGVTSDYRYRGLSQTNGDPALQASASVEHQSGFYAGAFASTLSDDVRPGDFELSAYVGYTRQIVLATDLDLGVQLYTFPSNDGAAGATYVEPYAALRHTIGPVTAEVGAAYAPGQEALGDRDSLHVYGNVSGGLIILPITVTARLGHTSGPARFTGAEDYFDWRVGAEYKTGPATFALEYVDTDLSNVANADATLVASLRFGF